ncbi:hypothetical protein J437_LFUL012916 [Ladona fulva]|uniref:Neurotransmitter-gated ion-channel ligand-binding domain-containing protein n=1 Tax=Ladona fulva TaxID=123851 RepID=A0A8K0P4Y9_LADFU|nr:hypothetical protein J437_LFUL012916 [Ladona fulva]
MSSDLESITTGPEYGQNLWMPDTFIVNERRTETHQYPANNEFLRIFSSGSVVRSVRITVTASCPMNFQYYPMDSQVCSIEIESYGYSMKDIRYWWQNVPQSVGISYSVSIPQYHIIGHRLRSVDVLLTTGWYSRN